MSGPDERTDTDLDLARPDLSPGSTPGWAVAAIAGFGAVITFGVLLAIQQDSRTAIEVGAVLITLGIVLAIGLITTAPLVRIVCALSLIAGGVVIFALGVMNGNALWLAGGVLIFLAGELILLRERLFPRKGA